MKAHQSIEGVEPGEEVSVDAERERFLLMYGYVGDDGDGNPPDRGREGPDYLMSDQRDADAEAEKVEQVREAHKDDDEDAPMRGVSAREGAKSRAAEAAEEGDTQKARELADKAEHKAAKDAEKARKAAERKARKDERDAAKAERDVEPDVDAEVTPTQEPTSTQE